MKLSDAEFTIFDVETTGLYAYRGDRICEIAAMRCSGNFKEVKIFHSLINPGKPISRAAFHVNRITEEMLRDKPVIQDILPALLKFIDGSVLVAYNAGFDIGFLENALGDSKSILYEYHIIDALKLARRFFPGLGRYNLKSVVSSLGIEPHTAHRALNDVYMTRMVFERELEALISNGIFEVEAVAGTPAMRNPAVKLVKDYDMKAIDESVCEQEKIIVLEEE